MVVEAREMCHKILPKKNLSSFGEGRKGVETNMDLGSVEPYVVGFDEG